MFQFNVKNAIKTATLAALGAVMLSSCGGQATPAAAAPAAQPAPAAITTATSPSSLKAEATATPGLATNVGAPRPQAPTLNAAVSPLKLTREGAVFFFLTTQSHAAGGLRTEITIDGKAFVDDLTSYNSYAQGFTASDNGTHRAVITVTDSLGVQSVLEQEFVVDIR